MYRLEYDPAESGLRTVLKDYQELAMRILWEAPEGMGSRAIWEEANRRLQGKTISRASIINFLEAVREMGVLKGVEKTGKGGHRWIYSPAMTESEFRVYIAKTIFGNLLRDFPEETNKVLNSTSI